MSPMRRVAREIAMSRSYKETHSTDMFDYYFDKIWRKKAGHKRSMNLKPTKPLVVRAIIKIKNKLARIARRLNRRRK